MPAAGAGHLSQEALRQQRGRRLRRRGLDVQMPGIDGFETARRLRRRGSATRVPIIFVTANAPTPRPRHGLRPRRRRFSVKTLRPGRAARQGPRRWWTGGAARRCAPRGARAREGARGAGVGGAQERVRSAPHHRRCPRSRDLDARPRWKHQDLQRTRRAHQGLRAVRGPRPAFRDLLHPGGPCARLARARDRNCAHVRPLRGRGLAPAQGRLAFLRRVSLSALRDEQARCWASPRSPGHHRARQLSRRCNGARRSCA